MPRSTPRVSSRFFPFASSNLVPREKQALPCSLPGSQGREKGARRRDKGETILLHFFQFRPRHRRRNKEEEIERALGLSPARQKVSSVPFRASSQVEVIPTAFVTFSRARKRERRRERRRPSNF